MFANYSAEDLHPIPDQKDEDLMVWMRTAALPWFRKLFRIIDHKVPKGTYTVEVSDYFPVHKFEGEKHLVLSTTTWIGGKNPFLGIAYIVVGCISMLLGIGFLIRHLISHRTPGEMRQYLTDQLSQPAQSE